jgi:uncharacterized lipoprotein
MKKLIATLLALAFTAGLAACGSSADNVKPDEAVPSSAPSSAPAEAPAEKTLEKKDDKNLERPNDEEEIE